ncbi:MAG: sigma-70 family RNA polymerase sigma factor [Verrucomicrobia bacterium]|nr:sigma-70 family RNA polymerase sigma factor [Verrucomicrobiota bacterium]
MEASDAECIDAVLNGDTSRFEELVIKYQPRVFGTVRRYSRRESEVEDIVQEVFIKAFRKLDSFRGDAPFEHWLMRLTVRTCYDFLRAHKRDREMFISDLAESESDWLDRFDAGDDRAEESLADARELIYYVLEKLPASYKMVIVLMEIEGRTVKEISELTGWSVSLVKVRAHRARKELRKHLERLIKDRKL